MRMLLLRHAETDWNRERRFQGGRDVPLSATGREQAESAARLLAATSLDALEQVLHELGHPVDFGAAVRAAQKVLAER